MGDISSEAEKSRYAALQDFLKGGEEGLTGIANEEYTLGQSVAQARARAAQRAAEYDLAWLNWEANNQADPDEVTETATVLEPSPVAPAPVPAVRPVTAAKPKVVAKPKPAPKYIPFVTDFPKPTPKKKR